MQNQPYRKLILLSLAALLGLMLTATTVLATNVQLSRESAATPAGGSPRRAEPDAPAWHRQLWEGSFDRASDASGAAARQLENLDFGDCEVYLQPAAATDTTPARGADPQLHRACVERKRASGQFAQQARGIQSQQNMMSVVSKVSDVAAVGAVGAVIYSELGVKSNNNANTYEQAARIQRTAGQVNYVTGATDFSMGAYAYMAHKNRLEQMQRMVSGSQGGVRASTDHALASSITGAAEAAKNAAYSHMMYGAGKMAAGYASIYLAKRSEKQAASMRSIEADRELNAMLTMRAQQQSGVPAPVPFVATGSTQVPYYVSNQPQFAMPTTVAATQTTATSSPATATGNSTGASIPFSGALTRSPASSLSGARGAGGGGGGEASGASQPPSAENPAQERAAREALGSSFEMQLSSGVRAFSGGTATAATTETPNLAALMGNGPPAGERLAATGLSPNQIYRDATEGTEGAPQGSMAGVNARNNTSLFDITRQKLNQMIQTGSVGMPRNVDVR